MCAKILVKNRKKKDWEIDENSYILIELDKKKKLIEVRIMKLLPEQLNGKFLNHDQVIADYAGETPEDLYYKIIRDEHITNLQHAAYLGSELRKAYIALKKNLKYIQDEEI